MQEHGRNFVPAVRPRRYGYGRTATSKDETPFMSLNAEDVPVFYNPVGRIKVDEEGHLVLDENAGVHLRFCC